MVIYVVGAALIGVVMLKKLWFRIVLTGLVFLSLFAFVSFVGLENENSPSPDPNHKGQAALSESLESLPEPNPPKTEYKISPMKYLKKIGNVIFVLIVLTSPFTIYLFFCLITQRKLLEEIGKTPVFQKTVHAVEIDESVYNCVRIALYDDFLVIVTILKFFIIPLSAIKNIEYYGSKGILIPSIWSGSEGLKIVPYDSGQHPCVDFGMTGVEELFNKIPPQINKTRV